MAFNLDQALKDEALQHLRTDVVVPWAWTPTQGNFDSYTQDITRRGNEFNTMFENLVGRAPTQDEQNVFVKQFVIPNTNNIAQPGSQFMQTFRDNLSQFVGDQFQGTAKQYAEQQLVDQQGESNRLADMYRTRGREAINDTEAQLVEYQQKLFDRLRPNLITSLQAQGLLNTGGVNTAMAGAASDLATAGQGALMDARLQNEQEANAIAYGGEAAPYNFKMQDIAGRIPYMQNQMQGAVDRGYNTFLQNMQYQNQLGLLNAQKQKTPSFLQRFGEGMMQAFNPLAATQMYQNIGSGYSGFQGKTPGVTG